MALDWDKLRIFHAAAEAGSFTHAGEVLEMSQSAVSRQVSALESDLGVPLFHRHARGLILTEQGELLLRTANEVTAQLEAARSQLHDTKEQPSGLLKVNTTVGLGSTWLASRIDEFLEENPDIQLDLILADDELDVSMREADVAIRLRPPTRGDLVKRRLFTVHFHVYAAPLYIERHGRPETVEDLDRHRIITFGDNAPAHLRDMNWLATAGRDGSAPPRTPVLRVNNLVAIKRAVEKGVGIAMLPDYIVEGATGLVRVLAHVEQPSFETYFVYPEEMRNVARVTAFRDFLLANARRWIF